MGVLRDLVEDHRAAPTVIARPRRARAFRPLSRQIGKGVLEDARHRSVRCVRSNAARVGVALADSFGLGAVFVVMAGGPFDAGFAAKSTGVAAPCPIGLDQGSASVVISRSWQGRRWPYVAPAR